MRMRHFATRRAAANHLSPHVVAFEEAASRLVAESESDQSHDTTRWKRDDLFLERDTRLDWTAGEIITPSCGTWDRHKFSLSFGRQPTTTTSASLDKLPRKNGDSSTKNW